MPIAEAVEPCRYSTSAAGIQMRPLPTTGRMANTTVTTPQKTAFGSPVTTNATPTISPWMVAVRPVPMTVEMVIARKRSRSRSALAALKGM